MIRSTFASFVTAQTGLNASQKWLDVTGHNMTNVNTDGYTRQRLDLYSLTAGGYTNRYAFLPSNDIGQGVSIGGVSQVRDPFLDVRFRREHAQLGATEAEYMTLTELETIFNETSIDKLEAATGDFVSRLQQMTAEGGVAAFDGIARSSAETLTDLFKSYSRQIGQAREQFTYQLQSVDVPRVNTILENVASLNKSIREDQTYGNPSLELMDQRNLLLDELSQYMQIDVQYTPVELAPGIVVEDVALNMQTSDVPPQRVPLVSNITANKLNTTVDAVTGEVAVTVDDSITVPGTTTTSDLTDRIGTGVFKGLIDMLNGTGSFAAAGENAANGIGYYQGMIDALAAEFAKQLNAANSTADPPDKPLFVNGDVSGDSVTGITAANISVSEGWRKNYPITGSKIPGAGDGATDNIAYMISLFKQKFDYGDAEYNGSFQDFYAHTVNTLTLQTNAAEKLVDNTSVIVNGVLDLREGVSAVSLDEEGINLIRYQKAYNASARFMTTLDEALDKLINGTGIVGR